MQVYIGIDWSESKHDVCYLNEHGAVLAQLVMPHTPDGFQKFAETCRRLGLRPAACVLGLETAHNLLIDFLWAREYQQVYVIAPNVVASSRERYTQSGAHCDRSDAYVIADVLRTDRGRLQPWHPDSLLTRQLQAKIRLLSYLARSRVRLANRLRAILLRYYPAGLAVFCDVSSQVALAFLQAYPTPQAAAALTFEDFAAFAQAHRYAQSQRVRASFARLQAPQPVAAAETVSVYQDEVPQLARLLLTIVHTQREVHRAVQELFARHPDHAIFASLPGAGELLAPALLAMFGDDRERFPAPANVQALAGTCPVTQQSGKRRQVTFRRACDREFRNIVQQWARCSLRASVWANAYWTRVRPRCASDSHAYRCLGNRWLAVVWKLWQSRQTYDEAYHLRQRAERSGAKPRQCATRQGSPGTVHE